MLKLVSRLLRTQQCAYARKVAAALFREGFDPKLLEDMQAIGAFSQDSLIFRVLRDSRLRPEDAARAVMLASHRYHQTRLVAKAQGWPAVTVVRMVRAETEWPRHEAYFLGLLQEAASSLSLRRTA